MAKPVTPTPQPVPEPPRVQKTVLGEDAIRTPKRAQKQPGQDLSRDKGGRQKSQTNNNKPSERE